MIQILQLSLNHVVVLTHNEVPKCFCQGNVHPGIVYYLSWTPLLIMIHVHTITKNLTTQTECMLASQIRVVEYAKRKNKITVPWGKKSKGLVHIILLSRTDELRSTNNVIKNSNLLYASF